MLDKMTIEELEERYDELGEACDDLQLSLDRSAGLAAEKGIYAPCEWFATTKHTLAQKRREYNTIARVLSRKKKEEKKTRAKLFGAVFIDVCRATLDHELFMTVMNKAKALQED